MNGYDQALAEIRALRVPGDTTDRQRPQAARESEACCDGSRNAYQRHRRNGEEACPASTAANNAYSARYNEARYGPRRPKVAFRVGTAADRYAITATRDEPDDQTVFSTLIKAKYRAVDLARAERNAWNQQIHALRYATHASVSGDT